MRILALIPARGGSKGVPGKNIKLLGGKPLIVYSLESAMSSNEIDTVVVSSDSLDVLTLVSKLEGVVALERPADLAQDNTPTLPVIQQVLSALQRMGKNFDAVCLLQATSPFRPEGFIDNAIKIFKESEADALVSVLPVPHEYNPHWTFEPSPDGWLKIATGEQKLIPRRQELPSAYFRDGAIYITKSSVLLEVNSLYGEKLAYIVSDPANYVNIDTPADWELAERLLASKKICVE